MKTRYTIIPKPLPAPEAFQRTVHEAEILCEMENAQGKIGKFSPSRTWVKEFARMAVRRFSDEPKEMSDNRLLSLTEIETGRWLVRIEEAYLD